MQVNKDYLADALIQFDLIVKDGSPTLSQAVVELNLITDLVLDEFYGDLKEILRKELRQAVELGEVRIVKRNKSAHN